MKILMRSFTIRFLILLVIVCQSITVVTAQNYNVSNLNHQLVINHEASSHYNANTYQPLINQHIQEILASEQSSMLNLAAITTSIMAGSITGFHQVNISIGSADLSVRANTYLTPAEAIAVSQLLNHNDQNLLLNSSGQAYGGSLNLNEIGLINNILIPHNVTAFINENNLTVNGNLVNYGNIYVDLPGVNAGHETISANNLFDMQGSSIQGQGVNNAPHDSLVINDQSSFINFGTVNNFNNISINSITGIVNESNAHIAANFNIDLNLNAPSYIINNGLIQGSNVNLSFSNNDGNSSNLISGSGQYNAQLGDININALNTKGNLNIIGADFISQNLNINAPNYSVIVDVNNISGILNVNSAGLSTQVFGNNLNLGNIVESSDPSFFNVNGAVNITGGISSPESNLAIVANTDITVSSGSISTGSQGGGTAGNIRLIAGANFTSNLKQSGQVNNDYNSILTIYGPSSSGGQINLNGCTGILANITNPYNYQQLTGSGGLVTIVAWAGTEVGSGTINIPVTCPIETGGYATGSNGNVLLIAGAPSGTSISLGSIDSSGGGGGGGNISLYTATPVITNTSSGQVIIQGGSLATNSDHFTYGTLQASSIDINGNNINSGGGKITVVAGDTINASNATINSSGVAGLAITNANGGNGGNAGSISLLAINNISVYAIIASGGGGAGGWSGGNSTGTSAQTNGYNGGDGGNGGVISINSTNGSFFAQSYIAASGGGGGGGGGAAGEIVIQYSGQTSPPPGIGGTGGIGGQSGTVSISAAQGINLNAPVEVAQGDNGGAGGSSSSIFYGGGGGGGGASGGLIGFGGGGGAGGYGAQYSGSGGGGGASAAGFGGGGGGGGNSSGINGGGNGAGINIGGLGGYNGGDTVNGTLGSNGSQGVGGNGGSYGIPIGYGGSFVNNLIIGGGGGSSASSQAQSGQNGGSINFVTGANGTINLTANSIYMNGSGSGALNINAQAGSSSTVINLNGFIDGANSINITNTGSGIIYSGFGVQVASPNITINNNQATIGQGSSNALTIASPANANINLTLSGTGATYINSLNQVSLVSINEPNSLVVSAQGAILVQSAINSGSIALATTANNSGIYIGANLGSANSNIFLTASGNSQIYTVAGSIYASNLYLYGGNGSIIGSNTSMLAINLSNLTVNSQGQVNVLNSSSNLNLDNVSVSGSLAILAFSPNVGGSNITSSGIVSANVLGIYANGVNGIGSASNYINVNAPYLASADFASNASVYVSDAYTGGVTLQSSSTAGTGLLSINAASTITVATVTTGGIIALATTANNGSLILDANLGSSNSILFLTATGSGNIYEGNANSIVTGNTLYLNSGSGSFNGLQVNVPTVTVATGGIGDASILDTASTTTLISSLTGGYVAFYAIGNLLVADGIYTGVGVNAIGGNILLANYNGSINIGLASPGHTNLDANNGSVTLTNYNTTNGQININSGATILGSSAILGVGNVTISIGSPIASNTGFTATNVTVNKTGLGNIYYGNNGILAKSPVNTLNAYDRNIIFDTNNLSASFITLGGNVSITADPPVLVLNNASQINNISTVLNNNFSVNQQVIYQNSNLNFLDNIQTGLPFNNLNNISVNYLNTNNLSLKPVVDLSNYANIEIKNSFESTSTELSNNIFKPIAYHNLSSVDCFGKQTLLINSRNDLHYQINELITLRIKKGSQVLLVNNGKVISIFNLNDVYSNSVCLNINDTTYRIAPGQHLSLTKISTDFARVNQVNHAGYRNVKLSQVNDYNVFTADFSIISLINEFKELKTNKNILAKILKTIALLQIVQNESTPFQQIN